MAEDDPGSTEDNTNQQQGHDDGNTGNGRASREGSHIGGTILSVECGGACRWCAQRGVGARVDLAKVELTSLNAEDVEQARARCHGVPVQSSASVVADIIQGVQVPCLLNATGGCVGGDVLQHVRVLDVDGVSKAQLLYIKGNVAGDVGVGVGCEPLTTKVALDGRGATTGCACIAEECK